MIAVADFARLGASPAFITDCVAHCVEHMARFYRPAFGFDRSYTRETADDMTDFLCHFDPRFDGFWLAHRAGAAPQRPLGWIAIDGRSRRRERALLRWFFVLDDARGQGAGRLLLRSALAFCGRRGYAKVELHTHVRLRAAVKLYESHGFARSGHEEVSVWGRSLRFLVCTRPLRMARAAA